MPRKTTKKKRFVQLNCLANKKNLCYQVRNDEEPHVFYNIN